MQAIVKATPKAGAEMKTVPIPTINADEVLIKVQATSICGTDLHIYTSDAWAKSRFVPPKVFGHEFCGLVVEVGSEVTQVSVGDHVTAETHVVCGQCPQCRTGQHHICMRTEIIGVDRAGCFAEYVKMPARNLWHRDPAIPWEWGSLMEPMGNAVHTVLAGAIVGKSVAVIGCGPIGMMAVSVAKAAGAADTFAIDLNHYRLQLAEQMGADRIVNASTDDPVDYVRERTGGHGVDVVLEMSGNSVAIHQGFDMLTNGGRLSMLGLPEQVVGLDITQHIVFKGATVQGITGRRMFETWKQTTGLLKSKQVSLDPLITHRLPLHEFDKAFKLMESGQCGKVILFPS